MKRILSMILIPVICLSLAACAAAGGSEEKKTQTEEDADTGRYLSFIDGEPLTMDPQCTTEYYTIPLNVFDRLVEVRAENGVSELIPSLAQSWEISQDGLVYTFHLRPEVRFSNGSTFTASDVEFTLKRLLTHPDSQNYDLVDYIKGAEELRSGSAKELEGFREIDDLTFEITLEYPYAPFLACLSTPGASILDEQYTLIAGDSFGTSVAETIGTGPYILSDWIEGEAILLRSNPNYWNGSPKCAGLRMIFLEDTVSQRTMYDEGSLDILDLEYLGSDAEYFIHGDIYRKNLVRGPRVGITYIALNESAGPLEDVRVRKALQLALDRELLMEAMISGRGNVENGIFPYGLVGHNPKLAEIPYDPEEARRLLAEAGYEEGFEIELFSSSSSSSETDQLRVIASMWEKIGVRTTITALSSEEFMALRKNGKLSAYVSTWSADYDDPDSFIHTFFGNRENSFSRSLCYDNPEVMERIRNARSIVDPDERIAEYQELERIIVQEEAAWIPLYSRLHLFVVSDRVSGFELLWNGWSANNYKQIEIRE